jgi:dCTP diphosphatase
MGIEETVAHLRAFVAERDWDQFHTPENLSKSISIEAAELLECYQWNSNADLDAVAKELADVLTYCFLLADKLELEPLALVMRKLEETKLKYPVNKARGTSEKYDRL